MEKGTKRIFAGSSLICAALAVICLTIAGRADTLETIDLALNMMMFFSFAAIFCAGVFILLRAWELEQVMLLKSLLRRLYDNMKREEESSKIDV